MRYIRQTVLDSWGQEGQDKIERTSVLVAGAGGLGCQALTSLARTGFGFIHVVDRDVVSESNLNRQVLYTDDDLGLSKAGLIQARLEAINPHVKVQAYKADLVDLDLNGLDPGVDIILSCLDNNQSRAYLAQEAKRLGLPLVDMAVSGFYGLVLTSLPGDVDLTDFSNLLEEAQPIPALATTVGLVANLGVNEIIKWTLGLEPLQRNRVLHIDLIRNEMEEIQINHK